MRILITGVTGLIGSALARSWQDQHQIIGLTRQKSQAKHHADLNIQWIEQLKEIDFNHIDVVVNLAGEPIANRRWTNAQKQAICASRWELTEQLVSAILAAEYPPHTLINGSAVGFYGRQSEDRIDESYQSFYPEFSHDICARWENLANRAKTDRTRVCVLRLGIVLTERGGALSKMLPVFKLGLGGRISHGQQYMSWIHIADLLAVFDFLLHQTQCEGIYNATAPMAVSNKQWTKLLAARLNRPAFIPMPAFVLRLLLGEMADILLYGQHVYPQRLLDAGYQFQYNRLRNALDALTL